MGVSNRLLLTAALAVAAAAPAQAGIASLTDRWAAGTTLKVCFLDGDAESRAYVARVASDWIVGTSLHLDFGPPPALRECAAAGEKSQVRIAFDPRGASWSYVGRKALEVPEGEPTMTLPGPDRALLGPHQILHEFGHAFGLMHEEEHPDWKCRAELNVEGMTKATGWTRDAIERNLQTVKRDDPRYLVSAVDPGSVMRLLLAPNLFQRADSPCIAPAATALSARDRELVQQIYPPRPKDVNASAPHQTVSIVLDGGMAVENYQALVAELRRNGALGVRQYVDTKGLSLGEILASEGLAPNAAVTKDFERFLCAENPHICSRPKGGAPVWSNQVAGTYTQQPQASCGARDLAKSVICLPNVRVESQRVLVEEKFDPSRTTVADLVVQKTRGCSGWDDACRRIVQRGNPDFPARFLDERLREGEVTELTVPARIYRVPVDVDESAGSAGIRSMVESFRQSRAKALRVAPGDIAVRVVEPVGNPRGQQAGPPELAPDSAAERVKPLRAMGYPLAEADKALLENIAAVGVAIWDTRVDVKHCEFQRQPPRVIQQMLAQQPPNDPEPQRSSRCSAPRPEGARFVARWDHGTGVAGILLAQGVAGNVIGVNPRAGLFSWELINGNQINANDSPFITLSEHDFDAKVVNISQTFERLGGATFLRYWLVGEEPVPGHPVRYRGVARTHIVVAAAGIETDGPEGQRGLRIDDVQQCRFVPACWSGLRQPNSIVSVVGLNADGATLLSGRLPGAPDEDRVLTNHGQAFDVSAVGEVVSTLHGDWVGSQKGSSFAAPYVTGLASLLIGKVQGAGLEVRMARIKERILATADRDTEVLRATSRFGRIHFARALDFEQDVVRLRLATACAPECTLRGAINRLTAVPITFRYAPRAGGVADLTIDFWRIRRLTADGDGTLSVVYDDGQGWLEVVDQAVPVNPDAPLTIGGRTIPLKSISDFTACSFSECDRRP
jgi:serralysin